MLFPCLTGGGEGSHPLCGSGVLSRKQEHHGHAPCPMLLPMLLTSCCGMNLGLSGGKPAVHEDWWLCSSTLSLLLPQGTALLHLSRQVTFLGSSALRQEMADVWSHCSCNFMRFC